MARRGSNKNHNETHPSEEDNEMTDTATEAPEAEAPTAPAAPAEPKPDYEANLTAGLIEFGTTGDVAVLQEIYRSIPAAARGKVQGVAMKAAMDDGLDVGKLGEALDAFNSLPAASKSTRTRAEVDPTTAGAIRLKAVMEAYDALKSEYGDDAHNLADQWYNAGETPSEQATQVERFKDKVVKAAQSGSNGGGPRQSFSEKLSDLIADGRLPVGSTVTGANGASAEVVEGGLSVNGTVHAAPTAAAKEFRTNDEGKTTSTNGWDFWTVEGDDGKSVTIGSLRKS